MKEYIFLLKNISEEDDRDCVAYIENQPLRFECDHYFGGVNLRGSCFSGSEFPEYEDIKTILSKEEYQRLIQFDNDIHNLGYGIKEGDERYQKGISLCKAIQPVFDKLNSVENKKLFEEVQEEEKEYLMDEFNLIDEEIEDIFDNYYLDYRDRSIICGIYEDAYDLGYTEATELGYVDNGMERYFNFETFAEDLLEDERYYQLKDGRVVCLSY